MLADRFSTYKVAAGPGRADRTKPGRETINALTLTQILARTHGQIHINVGQCVRCGLRSDHGAGARIKLRRAKKRRAPPQVKFYSPTITR